MKLPVFGVSTMSIATNNAVTEKPGEMPSGHAATPPLIRVYLLIDSRLVREALMRLFGNAKDLSVVGRSGKVESNSQSAPEMPYDLLIADAFDQECLARLAPGGSRATRVKVLLIGMGDGTDQFLAAVRAGVAGYLLQNASAADILAAARAPFRGEVHCHPQLCRTLFEYIAREKVTVVSNTVTSRPCLTLRQEKLVTLIARGLTNKEIASHLNLSEYTVRNHVHRILRSLRVANRKEAVNVAGTLRVQCGADNWTLEGIRELPPRTGGLNQQLVAGP